MVALFLQDRRLGKSDGRQHLILVRATACPTVTKLWSRQVNDLLQFSCLKVKDYHHAN